MAANGSDWNASTSDCAPGSILDEPPVRWSFVLLYVLVFLCCLIGNLLILSVITFHRSMRSSTNFFLANLACADLLVALFCVVQNLMQLFLFKSAHWPLGTFSCYVYLYVLHLVPCVSAGILMLVSFEKYVAVLHPLLARKVLTNKLRVALTAVVWLVSLVASVPYYLAAKHMRFGPMSVCTRNTSGLISFRALVTASFVLWYCAPLATLAFLYARIGCVLWQSAQHGVVAAGAIPQQKDDGHALLDVKRSGGRQRGDGTPKLARTSTVLANQEAVEARKKVIRLLVAVVLSFGVLTLPHHARLLWSSWARPARCVSSPLMLVQPLAYLLLFLNSGINPFLYAFFSERFRTACRDISRCDAPFRGQRWRATQVSELDNSLTNKSPRMPRPSQHNETVTAL